MTENDKDIQNVLRGSDAEGRYDQGRESALRDMLVSSFRGQMKAVTFITWGCMLVFAAGAVLAVVGFALAQEVREMILCATAFLASFGMIVVVKLWYWMLANRNAVQRELKRLELRIAELAERTSR